MLKNYAENMKKITGAVQPIQPNLGGNGMDWLCYLAGNSQTAPMIFSNFQYIFFIHFIKNPQTTIALPFLTHNISATGGVCRAMEILKKILILLIWRSAVLKGACITQHLSIAVPVRAN